MHDSAVPVNELERLFDALPGVVFFIKNPGGCYTHANRTLLKRLGLKDRGAVIGRHPAELFPAPLGASYAAQDRQVLLGKPIENQLEVHLFPNRAPGWCLTCKYPLRHRGEVTGVIGISRDLGQPDEQHPVYDHLLLAVEYLHAHFDETIRIDTLAKLADLSIAQLERHFNRVFQLSPNQMLIRLRIDAAMEMLGAAGSIASVGQACGYSDQSAFTRQFRQYTGLTPREYRSLYCASNKDAMHPGMTKSTAVSAHRLQV